MPKKPIIISGKPPRQEIAIVKNECYVRPRNQIPLVLRGKKDRRKSCEMLSSNSVYTRLNLLSAIRSVKPKYKSTIRKKGSRRRIPKSQKSLIKAFEKYIDPDETTPKLSRKTGKPIGGDFYHPDTVKKAINNYEKVAQERVY